MHYGFSWFWESVLFQASDAHFFPLSPPIMNLILLIHQSLKIWVTLKLKTIHLDKLFGVAPNDTT